MDTRYLRTLVATVESGSFSKAAEGLHLTQSAVSQRIKFLEEHIGLKLLDRSGSKLTLTAAGEVVLESARKVLAIQDQLLHDLQRLKTNGGISLCCTPTFGTVFLPRVLNAFMLENSETVDLKFIFASPDNAVEGVRNHEFDLAVIEHCGETDLRGLHVLDLAEDELAFVSSPELNLPAPQLPFGKLLEMRLLTRKDGCSSKRLVQAGLKGLGRKLEEFNGVLTSDDIHLTCQTILAGGGVSFMSKDIVRSYLEEGRMVAHEVEGFTHRRSRSVVLKKDPEKNELLKNFIDCVCRVTQKPDNLQNRHLLSVS